MLTQTGDIAADPATDLARGYRMLRRVEARLRLRSGRGADLLQFPSDEADRVASALAMGSAVNMRTAIDAARDSIAAASEALLTQVEAASA